MRDRPPTRTMRQMLRVFCSQTSPPAILALILLSATLRALIGDFRPAELIIIPIMVIVWPLQEWWAHKNILHLKPLRIAGRTIDPFFARVHRMHHADPSRFELIFLPLRVVFGAYLIFATATFAISRDPGWTTSFMLIVSIAALLYEWTHFFTHTDYRPRGPLRQTRPSTPPPCTTTATSNTGTRSWRRHSTTSSEPGRRSLRRAALRNNAKPRRSPPERASRPGVSPA